MSPGPSVEEVLIRTLKRAGELAVPDDVHEPFQIVDQGDLGGSGDEESESPALRSTRPALRVAVTGIAAVVLVAAGLIVLLTTSPSITIQRTRLSAPRGQLLLCGSRTCAASDHGPTPVGQSGPSAASPSFGDVQGATPWIPRGTWIVASEGRFVRMIKGSAGPVTHSVPGTIYLSAGDRRYYRFATGRKDGPLSVVGHSASTVTLKGAGGSIYVLNLGTSQLVSER